MQPVDPLNGANDKRSTFLEVLMATRNGLCLFCRGAELTRELLIKDGKDAEDLVAWELPGFKCETCALREYTVKPLARPLHRMRRNFRAFMGRSCGCYWESEKTVVVLSESMFHRARRNAEANLATKDMKALVTAVFSTGDGEDWAKKFTLLSGGREKVQ